MLLIESGAPPFLAVIVRFDSLASQTTPWNAKLHFHPSGLDPASFPGNFNSNPRMRTTNKIQVNFKDTHKALALCVDDIYLCTDISTNLIIVRF